MTFPTIPTVAAGRVLFANQADKTATRTFPALSGLTKNAGDLLIAIVATYQSTTNPQFSGWSDGFTECSDQGTATTMGIGVAYKWSTGSETAAPTVTQAATITGHASMCLLSIAGAHASTPTECGTIANGTTAAADPGSFNPSGWDVEDTLWIAVDANGEVSASGTWTACGAGTLTNYSDLANSNAPDSGIVGQTEIAVSFRQTAAAAEDRGAVSTHDLSNARNSALIIAVRPATVLSASIAATESTDTAAVTAAIWRTAQVAATETKDAAAVAASVTTGAIVAATETKDTAAVTAANWMTAQVAATDGADAASVTASATSTTSATITATDASDVSAQTVSVTTGATLATTDSADSATATGANWSTAQIGAADGVDAASVSASVTTGSAVAVTDSADAAAVTAQNWMTSQIVAADAGDVSDQQVSVTTGAAIAGTDAADTAAVSVSMGGTTTASIATLDAVDQALLELRVTTGATLVGTDGADTAVAAAQVWMTAQLAAIDSADAANLQGVVLGDVNASISTVEGFDTANVHGIGNTNYGLGVIGCSDSSLLSINLAEAHAATIASTCAEAGSLTISEGGA